MKLRTPDPYHVELSKVMGVPENGWIKMENPIEMDPPIQLEIALHSKW